MITRPKKRKTYVGETIGYLDVLDEITRFDEDGNEIRESICFCNACNNIVAMKHRTLTIAKAHAVSEGKKPSCGCLKYSGFKKHQEETEVNLINKRFENLLVVDKGPVVEVGKDKKKRKTWKCLCDCGQITYVTSGDLTSGNTKSCGCLKSIGEKQIANIFTKLRVAFEREYSFEDLLSDKNNPLRFDFAVFDNSNLSFLLEYQGEQHYAPTGAPFGQMQREITDAQKKEYCNKHGYKLFEIAYNEDIPSKIDTILQFVHDNTVPNKSKDLKV